MSDLLDKLRRQPEKFSFETEALGMLHCFGLTLNATEKLSAEEVDALSDSAYMQMLVSLTCYQTAQLRDGKFRPSDLKLSEAQVSEIAENELEEFAGLYVENNPYLWRKEIEGSEDGGIKLVGDCNEALHPKNEDESNVAYLRRLIGLWLKERLAFSGRLAGQAFKSVNKVNSALNAYNKLTAAAKVTGILSGSTLAKIVSLRQKEEDILGRYNIGGDLSKPQSLQQATSIPVNRNLTIPEFRPTDGEKTVDRLNDLIDLIIESNDVQERIASDIANATSKAEKDSRTSKYISIGIIVLTICSLGLTYWLSRADEELMDAFMDRLDRNSTAIVKPLESLNDSSKSSHKDNQNLMGAIESLNTEIRRLREVQSNKTNNGQK
jgi:hypothetical protein